MKKTQTIEDTIEIRDLIIAGWTGRDTEAVEKHILELEEIGISRPSSTPIFYRASPDLLTQDEKIIFLEVIESGICIGIIQWLRLKLYNDVFFENKPSNISSGWVHPI